MASIPSAQRVALHQLPFKVLVIKTAMGMEPTVPSRFKYSRIRWRQQSQTGKLKGVRMYLEDGIIQLN